MAVAPTPGALTRARRASSARDARPRAVVFFFLRQAGGAGDGALRSPAAAPPLHGASELGRNSGARDAGGGGTIVFGLGASLGVARLLFFCV